MPNQNDSASGIHARIIEANVQMFNNTAPEEDFQNGKIRFKIMRRLLEMTPLNSIIIYGLAAYKPREEFKGEENCNSWFFSIRQSDYAAYVLIEERRDGLWFKRFAIDIKDVSNLKTEPMSTNETKFNIFLTVSNPDKVITDTHCITLHPYRSRTEN